MIKLSGSGIKEFHSEIYNHVSSSPGTRYLIEHNLGTLHPLNVVVTTEDSEHLILMDYFDTPSEWNHGYNYNILDENSLEIYVYVIWGNRPIQVHVYS